MLNFFANLLGVQQQAHIRPEGITCEPMATCYQKYGLVYYTSSGERFPMGCGC